MDWKANHGGSWQGTPTYEAEKGKYPFVADHIDTVMGWLDGDFKTKRVFFEHYWGLAVDLDNLDPKNNQLVKKIRSWEEKGGIVEHILICREYDLAINRGYEDAKPGPFKEDTRILFEKDIDDIRVMFKKAHKQGLLKKDNYSLIQMVQHPDLFATDKRFQPLMDKVEGIAYESHQFNRHWPREAGWGKPEKVIQGAKWTLEQGKEYIFYYGPIIWKDDKAKYFDFVERDWLIKFWNEGLPKHHPKMHYYLNLCPHGSGRMRPCVPATAPPSIRWLAGPCDLLVRQAGEYRVRCIAPGPAKPAVPRHPIARHSFDWGPAPSASGLLLPGALAPADQRRQHHSRQ